MVGGFVVYLLLWIFCVLVLFSLCGRFCGLFGVCFGFDIVGLLVYVALVVCCLVSGFGLVCALVLVGGCCGCLGDSCWLL